MKTLNGAIIPFAFLYVDAAHSSTDQWCDTSDREKPIIDI